MIFLGAIGLIFVAFCRPIVALFTDDAVVYRRSGPGALDRQPRFSRLPPPAMCLEATFNGSGDTWTPTRLNFFCFWCGQIPLAWLLSVPAGLGPLGRLYRRAGFVQRADVMEQPAFPSRQVERAENMSGMCGAGRINPNASGGPAR